MKVDGTIMKFHSSLLLFKEPIIAGWLFILQILGWILHPMAGCTCHPGRTRTWWWSKVCRLCSCYLQDYHVWENRTSGGVPTGKRTSKSHDHFTKPIPPQRGFKLVWTKTPFIFALITLSVTFIESKNVEDTGSTPSYWPKLQSLSS